MNLRSLARTRTCNGNDLFWAEGEGLIRTLCRDVAILRDAAILPGQRQRSAPGHSANVRDMLAGAGERAVLGVEIA